MLDQLSSAGAITFRWFGAKLPESYPEYLTHIESIFHSTPAACNFVIYDKSYPDNDGKGKIAGTISYLNANPVHKTVEIGFVCILPEFQVRETEDSSDKPSTNRLTFLANARHNACRWIAHEICPES